MSMLATVLVVVVAVLHVGFMVLESILWTKPMGRRIFGMKREDAQRTAALASNQGVYNGMLAAGLLWGLLTGNPGVVGFLLLFVVVVGVYGAITVSRAILVVQALPALLGLAAMWSA